MLITFASLKGSPGVSAATLALTWAWPRHAIAAECDPLGSQALAVFDPDGAHGRRGVFELLLAARRTPLHRAMSAQMVTLPDGTGMHHLLPGAGSAREAASVQWRELANLFHELETVDVLADCGRLATRGCARPVLEAADLTVLVVRNDRSSLHTTAASLDIVREEVGSLDHDGLVVVVAGHPIDRGFPLPEIARELAKRGAVVVGALPWDPDTAARFTHAFSPSRRFETSPLMTAARRLAGEIGRRAHARAQRIRAVPQVREPEAPHRQLRLVAVPQPAAVPCPTPNKDV